MRTCVELKLGIRGNRKMRQCLYCDRWFMSSGPGNRRCPRCSKLLGYVVMREPVRLQLDVTRYGRIHDTDGVGYYTFSDDEDVAHLAMEEE